MRDNKDVTSACLDQESEYVFESRYHTDMLNNDEVHCPTTVQYRYGKEINGEKPEGIACPFQSL
jgi:hypothetical protein